MSNVATEWVGMLTDLVGYATSETEQTAVDRENARRIERAMARERRARVETLAAGGRMAGALNTRGTQVVGAQRVGFADSNLDLNSGTAADVQASSSIFAALDAETAKNNARAQALGHDAVVERYQTELREMKLAKSQRDAAATVRGVNRMVNFTTSALGGGVGGGM